MRQRQALAYLEPEDGLLKISALFDMKRKGKNPGLDTLNELLDCCYKAIQEGKELLDEPDQFHMSADDALYYLDPQYRVMRLAQLYTAGRLNLAVINNLINTAREAIEKNLELESMLVDDVLKELAEKKEENNNGKTGKSES